MDHHRDNFHHHFRHVGNIQSLPPFLIRFRSRLHPSYPAAKVRYSPLASSMFAPSVPQLMAEFKSTNAELASFVISVYILGFAVGPLVIAPCSEMYGRLSLYHICNVLFVVFTVACAVSSNLNMLIGFRFLAGCAGGGPLTLGGGTIADTVKQERRGVALTIYTMGPLLGPIIGPVAGGFLSEAEGWRWVFWILAIIGGVITVVSFLFMSETYALTILAHKAARVRKTTGNVNVRSKLDRGLQRRQLFAQSIIRPMRLLFLSPIVLSLSIFMALGYGYLYLLFTTFTMVFEEQYGFGSGTVGLTYLGLGVGSMIGLLGVGAASDSILRNRSMDGEMKPEYRLLPMIFISPLMGIGLLWYGWSASAKAFWLVPIVGTSIFGIGLFATMVSLPELTFTPPKAQSIDTFICTVLHYLVHGRRLHHLCRIGAGRKCRTPFNFWRRSPPFWSKDVRHAWSGMGKFPPHLHCAGHVSDHVSLVSKRGVHAAKMEPSTVG